MKKTKIILVILISVLLIACIVACCLLVRKTYDPSNNEDVLFFERYFKVELPTCKKLEIIEGDRNSRKMTVKLTVEKSEAQHFLEGVKSISSESVMKSDNYQQRYSNVQKSALSEFAKNKDAAFFKKTVHGYYVFTSYTLVGAYKKGICSDSIILCFNTSETEEKLTEKCGNEWYLWDNEIVEKNNENTQNGSVS